MAKTAQKTLAQQLSIKTPTEFEAVWEALTQYVTNGEELEGIEPEWSTIKSKVAAARKFMEQLDRAMQALAE